MPKTAIVFPYFRTRTVNEMLFPPLGAASLTAQLRQVGIETRVFRLHIWDIRTAREGSSLI